MGFLPNPKNDILLLFSIPFQIIDGKTLPFPEKAFDTVLINYVLHHSDDPIALLKEAKRVSKKIIIYEDLSEGILSKSVCKLHSATYNLFLKNNDNSFFKTGKEWEEVFQKMGLTLVFKKRLKNLLTPKELFVLSTSSLKYK